MKVVVHLLVEGGVNIEPIGFRKNKQVERWLFIALLISQFFPVYIGGLLFIFIFIYLIFQKKIQVKDLVRNPGNQFFTIFIAYSILVSLFHQNWVGVGMSLLYAVILLYFSYYEKKALPDMFDFIVNISMLASVVIFGYTLLEHLELIPEWDYSFIHPAIDRNHSNRVEATFFNPNYYAMILEFFIMMAIYKLMTSKTQWHRFVYLFLALVNSIAIVYTGNRTSPLVVFVALLIFFYALDYKKTAVILGLFLGVGIVYFIFTGRYPRIDNIVWALDDRIEIWSTAAQGIKDNFLFGQGPYTYSRVHNLYGGKFTYHAHSIYLDPLLNFGIIGTSLLLVPIAQFFKGLFRMGRYPNLSSKKALIWSFVAIFVVHGITDMAIYWFQTAFIFLAIVLLVPTLVKREEGLY